jgi:hypothetical protein
VAMYEYQQVVSNGKFPGVDSDKAKEWIRNLAAIREVFDPADGWVEDHSSYGEDESDEDDRDEDNRDEDDRDEADDDDDALMEDADAAAATTRITKMTKMRVLGLRAFRCRSADSSQELQMGAWRCVGMGKQFDCGLRISLGFRFR